MIVIARAIDSTTDDIQGVDGLASDPTKAVVGAIRDSAPGVHIQHTANRPDSSTAGIAEFQGAAIGGRAATIGVGIRELNGATRTTLDQGPRATDHAR